MKALRHDRRLLSRRGWITADALEKELASLPDVADKAQAMDAGADPAGSDHKNHMSANLFQDQYRNLQF